MADRFAFIVTVADWKELSDQDQRSVADPRGHGWISSHGGDLREFVAKARVNFQQVLADPTPQVIDYCRLAATALGEAGVCISPRRVRQWVRNILAIHAVSNLSREQQFRLALQWGLPQRATGLAPEDAVIDAAHRTAWDATCLEGVEKWLDEFHREKRLAVKAAKLLNECPDPDAGTLAITQLMANESKERAAAFALALYPLALSDQRVNVGAEGVQELGLVANAALDVEGARTWWDSSVPRLDPKNRQSLAKATHPAYAKCAQVFDDLKDARQARAKQLFSFLFLKQIEVKDPAALEQEFHGCIEAARAFQKNGATHGTAT